MPLGEITFTVNAPIASTWTLLSDMEKVAACTPNVESVRVIDGSKSEWTLKVKVGPLSRKIVLLNETVNSNPPTHAEFKGTGENILVLGQIDLKELSPETTEVMYKINSQASGSLKSIMENVIKSRLPSEMEEFKSRVKQRLEQK